MRSDVKLSLNVLRRQYFQLVEPSQLRWPEGAILKRLSVQSWIFNNLFDAVQVSILPPQRYQLRALKVLVSKLESSIDEPEEDVRYPSPWYACPVPFSIQQLGCFASGQAHATLLLPSPLVVFDLDFVIHLADYSVFVYK